MFQRGERSEASDNTAFDSLSPFTLDFPSPTSFAFILLCVPDPVCHTTSGKWSLRHPSATSEAAVMIASPTRSSKVPAATLAAAVARFTIPNARTIESGITSEGPPILKLTRERWVWAPQYLDGWGEKRRAKEVSEDSIHPLAH